MTATQPTVTRTGDEASEIPARPVTAVLLELAYLMHATRVVGVRGATSEALRQESPKARRSEGNGLSLAG